jgi:DNA-binding protein Fis
LLILSDMNLPDGNALDLTAAARALGATRETLRYRVLKYNLKIAD